MILNYPKFKKSHLSIGKLYQLNFILLFLFIFRKLNEQRDTCFDEISKYYQLKTMIENINESAKMPLQTQIDLGCSFYAEAVV